MSGAWLIALEAALVIGVVFAFGVWQLWSLRRERQRDAQARAHDAGDRPDA